jgi:transcriptional regulator with XRE-family HTH domain
MSTKKATAQFIREDVFGVKTQKAFGELLGYDQATISRFESGARRLNVEAQHRIRAAAKKRRINWNDTWFFEAPTDRRAAA